MKTLRKKGEGGGGRGHCGTQYCNTARKIAKYRNTISLIDDMPILHLIDPFISVTLTESCIHLVYVFIYIKHVCIIIMSLYFGYLGSSMVTSRLTVSRPIGERTGGKLKNSES